MSTTAAATVITPEPESRAHSRLRALEGSPAIDDRGVSAEHGRRAAAAGAATRVFVIDRRPLLRSGLAALARRTLGCNAHALEDVGKALAALRLVDSPPRAVLLGVGAGEDPGALVRRARRLGAPVICAVEASDGASGRAVAADADGYLILDGTEPDALRTTLESVEAGEYVIPSELSGIGDGSAARAPVTARCLEVLQSLADGLHDDEIAVKLGISTSSVRKHIAGAQERLEARTRTQVVAIVALQGFLG
jgi:two-component system, NarL family, response regulator DesR